MLAVKKHFPQTCLSADRATKKHKEMIASLAVKLPTKKNFLQRDLRKAAKTSQRIHKIKALRPCVLAVNLSLRNSFSPVLRGEKNFIIAENLLVKKGFTSFLPALGWLFISTVLLTLPGSAFPQENWLGKIWFDKWVHIGMFAALVFLFCLGIYKMVKKENRAKLFFYTLMAAIFYGIGMEYVQKYFVVNRSFDIGDIIADCVGSLIGLWFSSYRYIKKIDPCGNRGRNQN